MSALPPFSRSLAPEKNIFGTMLNTLKFCVMLLSTNNSYEKMKLAKADIYFQEKFLFELRIFVVKKLPFNFRACCVPPFGVFILYENIKNDEILKHESIHWKQYKRMGLFLFYFRYFFQLIFIGYYTMPLEMEARQYLNNFEKWNYKEIFHDKNK